MKGHVEVVAIAERAFQKRDEGRVAAVLSKDVHLLAVQPVVRVLEALLFELVLEELKLLLGDGPQCLPGRLVRQCDHKSSLAILVRCPI